HRYHLLIWCSLSPYTPLFRSTVENPRNENSWFAFGREASGFAGSVLERPCGLRSFSRLASLLRSRGARSTPSSRLTRRENVSPLDRKSTRLNSSHVKISYAVF